MQASAVCTETFRAGDARADGASREISFGRGQVLIRREIHGIKMRVGIPALAYQGVVLSLLVSPAGHSLYRIGLRHNDPDLCVTLREAQDDGDIVAEWKHWARIFALPKFIEREPGLLEGGEPMLGALTLGRGLRLRRRGAALSKRRPRAPLRRKPGNMALLNFGGGGDAG